ncbi:hypothetical protein [Azospirillum sp. TSO22-1]|uniref:lipase family protein n=1 Tax=Azospirillum sp. TSO22-1 TaxID=716789 RepID=UPI000D65DA9D|nr:hypothetical protein [Azospirillum sp. TSO22-1]
MTAYDEFQRTFCLSLLANRVWLDHGAQSALQAQLQQELSYFLTVSGSEKNVESGASALIGDWTVTWGPVVWQNAGSDVADNAMYVAYCPDVPNLGATYVVAIAATNPMSGFDWGTEDFDVAQVVDFSSYAPLTTAPSPAPSGQIDDQTGAYISMGTATGVYKLLQMVGTVYEGQDSGKTSASLADYLTGATIDKGATIVFTGHSLAGALSPTLALYLKASGRLGQFAAANVYPTAGASPGNANFANLFNTTFQQTPAGATSRQQWNTLLWNQFDVVPHAWSTQAATPNTALPSLANVADLYTDGHKVDELSSVTCLVGKATGASQGSGITYTPLRNQWLPGQLFEGWMPVSADLSLPVNVPPLNLLGELLQMAYQHMAEYNAADMLDVEDFAAQAKAVQVPLVSGVSKDTLYTFLTTVLGWSGKIGCGIATIEADAADLQAAAAQPAGA